MKNLTIKTIALSFALFVLTGCGGDDKATGKSQKIEIKGSSGLNDDEIEQMKRDAETHAEEDKVRREIVELK